MLGTAKGQKTLLLGPCKCNKQQRAYHYPWNNDRSPSCGRYERSFVRTCYFRPLWVFAPAQTGFEPINVWVWQVQAKSTENMLCFWSAPSVDGDTGLRLTGSSASERCKEFPSWAVIVRGPLSSPFASLGPILSVG